MQIVVVDGCSLNPGDLSWDPVASQGDLIVYDRTPAEEIVERAKAASILLTNKTSVSAETLDQLPNLKFISVLATGFNIVDVAAARIKNIPVSNVPGYGTYSVAQHTIALLLELTNHVGQHALSVNNKVWSRHCDWCYTLFPVMELDQKIMGIVGLGNIGQQVASIASALGMKIIYHNPKPKTTSTYPCVSLEELFCEADVVSLHCPVNEGNAGFVNRQLLEKMKSTAFLVNTARGQLINEEDLRLALENRLIAGAALDVLSKEPPPDDNPLLQAKNCIITPHMAWMSREARQRVMDTTAANIKAFLSGKPQHVVNP